MLNRPADLIRELVLPIGPAEVCAERLTRYAAAGVQRNFLWPLGDEVRQLELFQERVAPLVRAVRQGISQDCVSRLAVASRRVPSDAVEPFDSGLLAFQDGTQTYWKGKRRS